MKTKNRSKRKIIVSSLIFLLVIISFFILSPLINQKNESMEEEDHLVGGEGFYFNVFTEKTKNEEKNGVFENVNKETIFYASVQNSGKNRQVQLKAYLDYKEIPIQINNDLKTNHDLFLKDGENLAIPFTIPKGLEDNKNHKLLISLLVGTDTHESITKYETTGYAISYDFFLKNSNDMKVAAVNNNYQKTTNIDSTYSGLVINEQFDSNDNRVKLPPSKITKAPEEPFKLAYRLGHIDQAENFLLLVTIGWSQSNINNEKYLLLEVEKEKLGYGVINLIAPKEKGLYEITALVVPNPDKANPFIPLENSYRFTLQVE